MRPRSYKDQLLLRVEVETPEQLRQVNESGAVILDCYPGLGSMAVVASQGQLEAIEKLNLRYEIRHRNMQELIERQMPKSLRDDPFEDFFSGLSSIRQRYGQYRLVHERTGKPLPCVCIDG